MPKKPTMTTLHDQIECLQEELGTMMGHIDAIMVHLGITPPVVEPPPVPEPPVDPASGGTV